MNSVVGEVGLIFSSASNSFVASSVTLGFGVYRISYLGMRSRPGTRLLFTAVLGIAAVLDLPDLRVHGGSVPGGAR